MKCARVGSQILYTTKTLILRVLSMLISHNHTFSTEQLHATSEKLKTLGSLSNKFISSLRQSS